MLWQGDRFSILYHTIGPRTAIVINFNAEVKSFNFHEMKRIQQKNETLHYATHDTRLTHNIEILHLTYDFKTLRLTPARHQPDASQTQHFEIRRQTQYFKIRRQAQHFKIFCQTQHFNIRRQTQDFKIMRQTLISVTIIQCESGYVASVLKYCSRLHISDINSDQTFS